MKNRFLKSLDPVKIFVFLCAFFLFWVKGTGWLDPDFGWHYKMGELIIKSGIPRTDPFSYTMASFPYIDHEWLTDVIIFRVYNFLSYNFLSLIFSVVAVSCLAIILNGFKREEKGRLFKLSLLLLSISTIFQFFGVRPQVLSWLFLAIYLTLILDEKKFKKYFYVLPLLTILWANLHGSFAIGIFCLGFVAGLRFLRTKQLPWQSVVAFILSILSSFVNPYGWHLWEEVWRTVSDSALRWRILEWRPSLFSPILTYFFIVSLGYSVFLFRKKIYLEKIGLYLFFLAQSFLGVRYVPLFLVVSIPIYLETVDNFYEKASLIKFGKERWKKAEVFVLVFTILFTGAQSYLSLKGSKFLSEANFYPLAAVSYLKNTSFSGNLFSEYGWGGYLIWKFPEKKVFIDGRMPSWRRREETILESKNAMDDYIKMQTKEEESQKLLKKFDITLVLLPKEREQKGLEKLLGNYLLNKLSKKTNFSFIDYLKKNNWQLMYEDEVSQIYSKI